MNCNKLVYSENGNLELNFLQNNYVAASEYLSTMKILSSKSLVLELYFGYDVGYPG
jgi:hypothetical protein